MDAFEQVVSEIPGTVGLWVRTSINVELTPKQKALIGRPTSPRWELDIVAYSGLENLLYAVERKSYLNSRRVTFAGLTGADTATAGRYKLFSKANDTLRKVVFDRLKTQLNEPPTTASLPNPKVRLCLACEHIASAGDRKNCAIIRGARNWELWDEDWPREHLQGMGKSKYENQVSHAVAKLLRD